MILVQDLALVLLAAGGLGWLGQRYGFSIVGSYLLAGLLIAPAGIFARLHWHWLAVEELEYVQLLSQLGLIFLMFHLGFRLSLTRLKQLRLPVVLATVLAMAVMYGLVRWMGSTAGLGPKESLFLSAMMMVSSSTVISKFLQRTGTTHEKAGRLAMEVTVMEDAVTVMLLAVLGSLAHLGFMESVEILGMEGGFVIVMIAVAVLIIPRFITALNRTARSDVQTVLLIGLLLGFAWAAARSGYSLALGAVLLGMVVAGTRFRSHVERVFGGTRDLFLALFFVSAGMMFRIEDAIRMTPWILGMGAVGLILRPTVNILFLMLAGRRSNEAIRAGLLLSPIGEFSFIIVQIGVTAGILSQSYETLAVSVALMTMFGGMFLSRYAGQISWLVRWGLPLPIKEWVVFYQRWIERIIDRGQSSRFWQMSAGRLVQVTVQFLLVTGLLVVSGWIFEHLKTFIGRDYLWTPKDLNLLFGLAFGAVLLIPLIGLWRNLSAIALMTAHSSTRGFSRREQLRPLVEFFLKMIAGIPLALWFIALLPFQISLWWVLLILVGGLGIIFFVFRKQMTRWHSALEFELAQTVSTYGNRADEGGWLFAQGDWNLTLKEVELPDQADCAGQTLLELELHARFGCSVVSIDRQGFLMEYPGANTALYPGDNLLLLGTREQIESASLFLRKASKMEGEPARTFSDMVMEEVRVEKDSTSVGKSLAELNFSGRYGVWVAAIRRGEQQIANPSAKEKLREGDTLLIIGTPERITALQNG